MAAGPATHVRAAVLAKRGPITVGSVRLTPCLGVSLAWCARINVPYQYGQPAAGTIKLGFMWYPATGSPAGTILAVQGGPGYATTDYASAYYALFQPLLSRENLLLVNLRGTGNSSPVTCKPLQDWNVADGTAAYVTDTGTCGYQLNHSRILAGTSAYVRGSDLYTTDIAARDVALLLHRLELPTRVDLYGDSYGTFFSQVFTAHYASLLRSVTLDAAYPVSQTDPWYPHTISTARNAFTIACARSVACHRAAPGSSWARIAAFAAYLRKHPITGKTTDPYGDVLTETVGVDQLIELVNDAGEDEIVYRELDPAIRAVTAHHDDAPLLRLAAWDIWTGNSGPANQFDDGSYQATTCLDYPQPFSYSAPLAQRAAQYAAAVAALPENLFAPFTVHEWVTEPDEEFDACLDWPAPPRSLKPVNQTPTPYVPRSRSHSLPVLVLSGDLDSLTTPAEGRETAHDMGPSARWILIHNDVHINAMDDTFGCAAGLVDKFIADLGGLKTMNASCARHTPEVRVLGSFPQTLAEVTAATPAAGNQADVTGRRLAAVGAAAVGDAEWNWYYGDGEHGFGLRGGTESFSGPATATVVRFHKVRWTTDTTVSGHARWDQVTGLVRAWLLVTGPGGITARVDLSYLDYTWHPAAAITGSFEDQALAARLPAP